MDLHSDFVTPTYTTNELGVTKELKQFDVFATDNMLYHNLYFPDDKQVVFEDSTRRQPLLQLCVT